MSSGYEQIYEGLLPKLRECDLAEAAQRLALPIQPDGTLLVRFLGREYEISACGVNPTDGQPAHVNTRNVLAYYVLSKGAGEPAFSNVPISHLTGSKLVFSSNINWMTAPLGKRFGEEYPAFGEAMVQLGGAFGGRLSAGGSSWLLNALPKIPLQIVYYEGDDEFSCEVQILFDKNASRFLEFECLAFMQGCVVKALMNAARPKSATDEGATLVL